MTVRLPTGSTNLGPVLLTSFSFEGDRNAFLTALNHVPFFPILQSLQVRWQNLCIPLFFRSQNNATEGGSRTHYNLLQVRVIVLIAYIAKRTAMSVLVHSRQTWSLPCKTSPTALFKETGWKWWMVEICYKRNLSVLILSRYIIFWIETQLRRS